MQYSVKSLLFAFTLLALTIATALYPIDLFLTIYVSAVFVLILFGLLSAIIRSGKTRSYWVGFTIFSVGYVLMFSFYERDIGDVSPPRLLTTYALYFVNDWITKFSPSHDSNIHDYRAVMYVGNLFFTIVFGLVGALIALRIYKLSDEPSRSMTTQ
jgi:hypothetical protein